MAPEKTVQQARFERIARTLDYVLAAARPGLEALGIALRETSNRSGWDWVQTPQTWSWEFSRTSTHSSYTARTTATVRFASAMDDDAAKQATIWEAGQDSTWEATWRAEAWQGTSPNFHLAEGRASIGEETFTYGQLDRLVLALLRRAAPAFPELLENAGWEGFPDLPSNPGPVDHLVEVKAFHKESVEPWTGPPVGSPAHEIEALEERLGWRLPLAYRQYLLFMGADQKGTFVGCDWFLESAHVNIVGGELAYMEVDYTPPGDTLTFMSHQGYIYGWMDLPVTSDDPPVHFYNESVKNGNRVVHYVRFTDLLLAELKYMSRFTRQIRPKT